MKGQQTLASLSQYPVLHSKPKRPSHFRYRLPLVSTLPSQTLEKFGTHGV